MHECRDTPLADSGWSARSDSGSSSTCRRNTNMSLEQAWLKTRGHVHQNTHTHHSMLPAWSCVRAPKPLLQPCIGGVNNARSVAQASQASPSSRWPVRLCTCRHVGSPITSSCTARWANTSAPGCDCSSLGAGQRIHVARGDRPNSCERYLPPEVVAHSQDEAISLTVR